MAFGLNLFLVLIVFSSFVSETPVKELFGESFSWIVSIAFACLGTKGILGGLSMAVFRIICLKHQNIARSLEKQKRIRSELLILELITLFFFIGFYYVGVAMSGTDIVLAFCKGSMLIVVKLQYQCWTIGAMFFSDRS